MKQGCFSAIASVYVSLTMTLLMGCDSSSATMGGLPGAPKTTPPPVAAVGATSDSRIDAAVAAGNLTEEEGWTYRLKARFEPLALPEQYRPAPVSGPDVFGSAAGGDSVLFSFASALPTLKPAAQKELAGFFIPPIYAGSKLPGSDASRGEVSSPVFSANKDDPNPLPTPLPQDGWKTTETTDIKVWWQEDQPDDEFTARRLIGIFPTVKNRLDAAMKRTYLDDSGIHRFKTPTGEELVWGDGGNGKLDIFIVNFAGGIHALTVPYPPGCSEVASFMLVDQDFGADMKNAEAALSHEYLHVLQATFPHGRECKEYDKVDEGTATWAIQYVFPDNRYERETFFDWFIYSDKSLAVYDYETWPFYVFIERTLGMDLIRQIFAQYAQKSGLDAVNAVLPGGIAQQFPLYTIREWNQTEVEDDFRDWLGWDRIPMDWATKPTELIHVTADEKGNFREDREVQLEPGTRKYFHFIFDDPAIRSVGIEAVMAYDFSKMGRLKVLTKYEGRDFEIEDWSTNEYTTEFCKDVRAENLEEIVLIYSNVDYRERESGGKFFVSGLNVQATNLPCKTWKGQATADYARSDSEGVDHMRTTTHVEFERDGVNDEGNFTGVFNASSGTGTYDYSGKRYRDGKTCTGTASGGYQVDTQSGANFIGLYPHQVGTANERYYMGAISMLDPQYVQVTFQCPAPTPSIQDVITLPGLSMGYSRFQAGPSGRLTGRTSFMDTDYTWDFGPKE